MADDPPVLRHARLGRLHPHLGVDVPAALGLVGTLVAPLALAFAVPAAVALLHREPVWPFVAAAGLTAAGGLALQRAGRGRPAVGAREGFLVVCLVWLLIAAFGAIPYVLGEPQLRRPVDAYFESMSGFSTTGASVLRDVEALPRSTAMWRQFTQWLGGLGIIVLFLAVLPRLNVGGRHALFRTEMPGPDLGLEATIRETARRFAVLYVALTGIATLVLAAYGWVGIDERMTMFNAIAHAFATVATAGFSPEARSFELFAPVTQWTVVVFMVVAGTNFALLLAALVRRRPAPLARDEEFRVYLLLLAVASAIVLAELRTADVLAGDEAVRHAVFNTVSMMTTTGFASADFADWTPLATLMLIGVALIGASAGSTSGSIKLVRHVVIAKMLRREVRQSVHPELVAPLRLNRRVIAEPTLRAIIVFVFLFLGCCAAGALAIIVDSSLQRVELGPFEALAASVATLSGAGPSVGFSGPMGSYAPFSDVSTLVLTAQMYLGRLEIVPVLVVFARSYWRD
jgi:trk system potassium uptake protein TrkH